MLIECKRLLGEQIELKVPKFLEDTMIHYQDLFQEISSLPPPRSHVYFIQLKDGLNHVSVWHFAPVSLSSHSNKRN